MMQLTKVPISLLIMGAVAPFLNSVTVTGRTVYSIPFDYTRIAPSSVYFSGKSRAMIDHLCKTGGHTFTADAAACEQRDFERVNSELNAKYSRLTQKIKEGDLELKAADEPVAQPYFSSAQKAWVKYRDSYCYSYVYAMGEASARYIYFWGCMKSITQDRLMQLDKFSGG